MTGRMQLPALGAASYDGTVSRLSELLTRERFLRIMTSLQAVYLWLEPSFSWTIRSPRRRRNRHVTAVHAESLEVRTLLTAPPIVIQYSGLNSTTSEWYAPQSTSSASPEGEAIGDGSRTISLIVNESGDGWAVSAGAVISISLSGGKLQVSQQFDFSYSGPNGSTIIAHYATDFLSQYEIRVYMAAPLYAEYSVDGTATITTTDAQEVLTENGNYLNWGTNGIAGTQSETINETGSIVYQGEDSYVVYDDQNYFLTQHTIRGAVSSGMPFIEENTASWTATAAVNVNLELNFRPHDSDLSVGPPLWKINPSSAAFQQKGGPVPRGSEIDVDLSVINIGTSNPGPVPVQLNLRYEDGSEFKIGEAVFEGGVAPGRTESMTTTFVLPADMPTGSGQLVAVVDPQNVIAELNEDNNSLTGQRLNVSALKPGVYAAARNLALPVDIGGRHQFLILVPTKPQKGTIDLGDGTRAFIIGAYQVEVPLSGGGTEDQLIGQPNQATDVLAAKEFVKLTDDTPSWYTEVAEVFLGKTKIDAAITKLLKSLKWYQNVTKVDPIQYPSDLFQAQAAQALYNGELITADEPGELDWNSNSWVQSIVEYNIGPGTAREDFSGLDVFYWTRIARYFFTKRKK